MCETSGYLMRCIHTQEILYCYHFTVRTQKQWARRFEAGALCELFRDVLSTRPAPSEV
jgi:hypothetical protein